MPGDRVAGVPYIGQPPTVCFSNVVSDGMAGIALHRRALLTVA